jgi:Predicted transcriptional regulators
MRTERRTYADPCGISRALDVVGERWALLVVRELLLGPRRYGQLREGLPDMSPNVLSQRLRELEADGVVQRRTLEPPASVTVYELTERGQALEPVLLELGRWGSAGPRIAGREMSSSSMMLALKAMHDSAAGPPVRYGIQLGDEQFGLGIDQHGVRVSRGRPEDADARLATSVGALRMVVFLGTGIRAAEEAGALTISGDRRAAIRLPKYFRRPSL